MITLHNINNRVIAEITDPGKIIDQEVIPDLMADSRYNDSGSMIIHEKDLGPDFFDLKTGIAGEILQKFSNYRMKLAIVGNFSEVKSKSLRDFIRESNRTGIISFVADVEEALTRLSR